MRWFTSYSLTDTIPHPWFGIGPVRDSGTQRVIGVSVSFGRRAFAIHRSA